jgi:hypothetical protein
MGMREKARPFGRSRKSAVGTMLGVERIQEKINSSQYLQLLWETTIL